MEPALLGPIGIGTARDELAQRRVAAAITLAQDEIAVAQRDRVFDVDPVVVDA